jgi:hypothetical protein
LLAKLTDAHAAGRLRFFGDHAGLGDNCAFAAFLAPLRKKNLFVYAKPPFAGPEAVLAYLSRYTHRVAISNSRLIALDEAGVTFRVKDYRRNGNERYRTMTLDPGEFIRRFLGPRQEQCRSVRRLYQPKTATADLMMIPPSGLRRI